MLAKYLSSAVLEPQTDKTLTDPAALQAEIQETRERGYSVDQEEFMEGMVAIAVPIFDDLGRLMSTLSVHAPTQRATIEVLTGHLGLLQAASKDMSEMMLR